MKRAILPLILLLLLGALRASAQVLAEELEDLPRALPPTASVEGTITYDNPPGDYAPGDYDGQNVQLLPPQAVPDVSEAWILPPGQSGEVWDWHFLSDGLVYRPLLAGWREPRFESLVVHEKDQGWLWDIALGGQVSILRYGDTSPSTPDGWEWAIDGAGFPRLDLENNRDLVSADFRFGTSFAYGQGPVRAKLGFYHLSSHVGDEFLLRNPNFVRVNFSRDVILLGMSYYFTPDLRTYGDIGWSFYTPGPSKPWEMQLGIEYSPAPRPERRQGPFAAANVHLAQENKGGATVTLQGGWQWRGTESAHLLRIGLEFLDGKSPQEEFFDQHEQQIALGAWYDY